MGRPATAGDTTLDPALLKPVVGCPLRVSTCLPAVIPGFTGREVIVAPGLEGAKDRPAVDWARFEAGRTSGLKAAGLPGSDATGVGL
jgi:hypothetical protein